uniref:Uncharacterized protein n=1 Tax=Timema poppense TaxID=170557 RepID=A0A7R9CNC6_TIMPO|nr:unnamed protein product [Timema poppensis]
MVPPLAVRQLGVCREWTIRRAGHSSGIHLILYLLAGPRSRSRVFMGLNCACSSLSPQEHHLSSLGCTVPIVVYENEPSSIIAYALSSPDYHCNLDDAIAKQHSFGEPPSASPSHKRKSGQSQTEQESGVESTDSRRTGVLSFLRGTAANARAQSLARSSVATSH